MLSYKKHCEEVDYLNTIGTGYFFKFTRKKYKDRCEVMDSIRKDINGKVEVVYLTKDGVIEY